MNWKIVVIASLIVSLPGCILFRDGSKELPAQWPPQQSSSGKKSISLHVTTDDALGGSPSGSGKDVLANISGQAFKAYTESGLFSSVTTTGESADLIADINVVEKAADGLSWSAVISAITFTVIPGRVPQELSVKTVYKNREQQVIATVEEKEELGHWVEFFLLFAMPFTDGPNAVTNEAQYDLHRLAIDEARRKGIF